jgi:hypothetical protein
MVTNTPPNGNGGIIYQLVAFVPEPGSLAALIPMIFVIARRRR